jgi:hypothetical protein
LWSETSFLAPWLAILDTRPSIPENTTNRLSGSFTLRYVRWLVTALFLHSTRQCPHHFKTTSRNYVSAKRVNRKSRPRYTRGYLPHDSMRQNIKDATSSRCSPITHEADVGSKFGPSQRMWNGSFAHARTRTREQRSPDPAVKMRHNLPCISDYTNGHPVSQLGRMPRSSSDHDVAPVAREA